ncbi:hypothetical protein ACJJTC_005651 [Scirpophaga incertulas]
MTPSDTTKKILEDFIEIYKSNPCLWQIKNKDYHNRDKKEAAYKLLIEKIKKIEPDANKDVVVKKKNNLRSNVRKEKKKYEQSLKSEASADDVYHIKLWYYDLFNFIHDQCTPGESSSNLDSDDENSCGACPSCIFLSINYKTKAINRRSDLVGANHPTVVFVRCLECTGSGGSVT